MSGVSVIVPAFDAAKTLEETLRGVLAQTRPADEIIVVDDGSADGTAATAEGVPGVRVLRTAHAGTGGALNAGVRASTHPHVALLDADDLWDPRCLEIHAAHLARRPELDASVGWVSEFICPSLSAQDAARFRPRPAQPGWLSGATFFRRADFERVGPFDAGLRSRAWIDWMDRARLAGVRFGVTDEIVLRRRLHPASLSVRARSEGDAGALQAVKLALARRRKSP